MGSIGIRRRRRNGNNSGGRVVYGLFNIEVDIAEGEDERMVTSGFLSINSGFSNVIRTIIGISRIKISLGSENCRVIKRRRRDPW